VADASTPEADTPVGCAERTGGFRLTSSELAGAFGDLGTLVPFVAAYLAVVRLDPTAVLVAFGAAYLVVGIVYRTPFPVQPMKAIGAVAVAQSVPATALSAGTVHAAGLVTAVVWTLLAVTGLAQRVATWIPRPVVTAIVMGLGLSLMLDALALMSAAWPVAAVLLALAFVLLGRRSFLAMLVLLGAGAGIALYDDPGLAARFAAIELGPRAPAFGLAHIGWHELWTGATLLALPQVPLTLGNAFIATVEQANRLFPGRPVSQRAVALSTGLMNFWSAGIGGVPMCHGAGGMAGHVQFGARTGAAPVVIGAILLLGGLFCADAVALFFHAFPRPVLGVILFLAGAQLALANCGLGSARHERFVVLTTAAVAVWHVGVAFVFGLLVSLALRRDWMRLT
jgi:hypothetical protein